MLGVGYGWNEYKQVNQCCDGYVKTIRMQEEFVLVTFRSLYYNAHYRCIHFPLVWDLQSIQSELGQELATPSRPDAPVGWICTKEKLPRQKKLQRIEIDGGTRKCRKRMYPKLLLCLCLTTVGFKRKRANRVIQGQEQVKKDNLHWRRYSYQVHHQGHLWLLLQSGRQTVSMVAGALRCDPSAAQMVGYSCIFIIHC